MTTSWVQLVEIFIRGKKFLRNKALKSSKSHRACCIPVDFKTLITSLEALNPVPSLCQFTLVTSVKKKEEVGEGCGIIRELMNVLRILLLKSFVKTTGRHNKLFTHKATMHNSHQYDYSCGYSR